MGIIGKALKYTVGGLIVSSMSDDSKHKRLAPPPTPAHAAPINMLDEASKSAQSSQANQMAMMRGLASTWNQQSMMTSKAGFANTSTTKSTTLG